MNKVIDFVVIATTVATVSFAGDVLASTSMSGKEQLNKYNKYRSDRITQIRADKNLRGERFLEKLNLDSSQQKQMETIRAKYQPQIQNLREDIRSEREKLAQMMKSNDSNSNLRSQHQKIIDLDQKMHNLRFEVMLEMREVLTTEQRQQWVQSMEELKANRRGRFRRNRGRFLQNQ